MPHRRLGRGMHVTENNVSLTVSALTLCSLGGIPDTAYDLIFF